MFGVQLIGDMRSYVGLKGRETQPPDGRWYVVMWCRCDSKYARKSGHSKKNGVLELAHIAENDTRSSREGDQKKTQA
jgi:hypothetical protein